MKDLSAFELMDLGAVIALACGAVALVGALLVLRWMLARGLGVSPFYGAKYSYRDACAATAMFADRISKLRGMISLLEPYTVEYLHVFQSSGWVAIVGVIEDVELAGIELERRMEARDYDGVVALVDFLCTNDRAIWQAFIEEEGDQFAPLVAWEERIVDALNGLLDQLRKAAEVTQGLGVVHRRNRTPTTFLVDELKRDVEALREEMAAEDRGNDRG